MFVESQPNALQRIEAVRGAPHMLVQIQRSFSVKNRFVAQFHELLDSEFGRFFFSPNVNLENPKMDIVAAKNVYIYKGFDYIVSVTLIIDRSRSCESK